MLREDKEKLIKLATEYGFDEILKILANVALDKSDDACDLNMKHIAKKWTSYSIILENALIEIQKLSK